MTIRRSHGLVPQFLLVLATLIAPHEVLAGPNAGAYFMVHLTAPVGKNGCTLATNPPGCNGVVDRGTIGPGYYAYVLVAGISPNAGLSAVQFGIRYDDLPGRGVDVYSWVPCADYEFRSPFPAWPASGGGNLLLWDGTGCHHAVVDGWFETAVAGYFYVSAYSRDDFETTPRPVDHQAAVRDCNSSGDVLTFNVYNPFGWASFSEDGSIRGSSPCGFSSGGCHILGPDTVAVGQSGVVYTMRSDEVWPTGYWQVYGNAQITSSDNTMAVLEVTGNARFTIGYQRAFGCVEGCGCSRRIEVEQPVPVESTTWSRIKTMADSR